MLNRFTRKRGPSDRGIFISYRRKLTWPLARSIREALQRRGYDVFLDVESIDNGTFDTIILQELQKRRHFLIILTLDSVKRCIEPEDWVRREIETAMSLGSNIVPIMVDDFTFGAAGQYLTGKLGELGRYNSLRLVDDYFEAAMDKLRDRFLKTPTTGPIPLPGMAPFPPAPATASKPNVKPPPVSVPSSASGAKAILPTRKTTVVLPTAQRTPEEFLMMGDSCAATADYNGALRNYTHFLEASAPNAEVLAKRAYAYRKKNDTDHALADYTEAIRLDPKNPTLYNNRGDLYNSINKYAEAIADYSQALSYDPDFSAAYYNRGLVYALTDAYSEAIDDYSHAITLNPQGAAAYFYRGMAHEHLGQVKEALSDYDAALEIEPDYFMAVRQRDLLVRNSHADTRESPSTQGGS